VKTVAMQAKCGLITRDST